MGIIITLNIVFGGYCEEKICIKLLAQKALSRYINKFPFRLLLGQKETGKSLTLVNQHGLEMEEHEDTLGD